jgi:hypothetical protein
MQGGKYENLMRKFGKTSICCNHSHIFGKNCENGGKRWRKPQSPVDVGVCDGPDFITMSLAARDELDRRRSNGEPYSDLFGAI